MVQEVGGFPTFAPAAADYALSLALARRGLLVLEERDVVRYRHHASNMSRDPLLMLRLTLAVLHAEARTLPADYAQALTDGLRQCAPSTASGS